MSSKWLFIGVLILATVLFPVSVRAETTASDSATSTTTTSIAQKRLAERQNAIAARKETRAEFQEKLNKLKDEKKKIVVDRLNTKIAESNTKATGKMKEALAKFTIHLTRLQERSANLKAAGKDTANLDRLITTATTAVATAITAVEAQAAKIYTLTITNDVTVKAEVGKTTSQFRLDIQAAHKTVTAARLATLNAFAEAAKLTEKRTTDASGSVMMQ